ncbi:LysM peptidoglycan-binding domain-containing protein [Agreia sp.]|uniref:LysM peptidoglycan-binding domain-containing protein n=1 Tax=Agreia sp. TaxID=1872416 RepID=UPI0035BBC5D3
MTALPAPASHAVRLRITHRGRVVLASLVSLPLVAGVVALALFGANSAVAGGSGASAAVETFDYVTVQAGETLWGLAEEIAPSADPRDVIADIVNLNQLPSADVQPGQRLAVPGRY